MPARAGGRRAGADGRHVDNVKGVPGIGEKGARDLIATHGSLEALLAAGRRRSRRSAIARGSLAHADEARQSRELVTIRTDVPGDVRSRGVPLHRRRSAPTPSSCSPARRSARSSPSTRRRRRRVERDYAVVEPAGIDALVAECRAAGQFALHVVTDGDSPMRATLVGLASRRSLPGALRAARAHARHRRRADTRAARRRAGLFDEPEVAMPAGPARAVVPAVAACAARGRAR